MVSEASEKTAQIGQPDSVQDVRLFLEAAKAIRRLIGERDALRSRVGILECELTFLRQQTTLTQDSYRRLASEFVTQFQLIDSAISNLFREPTAPAGTSPAEQSAEAAPPSHQRSLG